VPATPGTFRIETARGTSTARWPPAPHSIARRQEPDYVIEALETTWDADGSSLTVVDTLLVPRGSTVRWSLVAGIHTVTNGRDSADPEAGTKFSYLLDTGNPTFDSTFTDSTVLDFFCYFHEPVMVGRLVVQSQTGPEPPPSAPPIARFSRSPTPNPTLGSLSFSVALPLAAEVDLGVFDLAGRRVATIFSGPLTSGEHPFMWDGSSDRGPLAPAGRYEVRLRAGSARDGRGFALLR
jgi:plastocyanin